MKTTYIIQEAGINPHGIHYYDCPDTAIFTSEKQALKTLLYLEKNFASGYRYRLVKRVETIEKEPKL
jgi:hypothetical protein